MPSVPMWRLILWPLLAPVLGISANLSSSFLVDHYVPSSQLVFMSRSSFCRAHLSLMKERSILQQWGGPLIFWELRERIAAFVAVLSSLHPLILLVLQSLTRLLAGWAVPLHSSSEHVTCTVIMRILWESGVPSVCVKACPHSKVLTRLSALRLLTFGGLITQDSECYHARNFSCFGSEFECNISGARNFVVWLKGPCIPVQDAVGAF